MNELVKNPLKEADSLFRPHKLCEVCEKDDDEDLYIIFNILYRVLVGDVFYQGSLKDDLSYDLEELQEEKPKQITEESKSSEEKLKIFQQNVSREVLHEIISSSQFDQLLCEIFKSKYSKIYEGHCKHQELIKHFIQNFNVSENKHLQAMDNKREKTLQNKDRLDSLLTSICQLKDNIQNYHSEINKLSNHIISRLFSSQNHSEQREKSSSQEVERAEPSLETLRTKKSNAIGKTRSGRANTNTDDSTAPSSGATRSASGSGLNGSGSGSGSGSGGENNGNNQANGSSLGSNGSSENSTDSTSNNNNDENNKKKSKALPFKSKLPKKATDILKKWFLHNINSPYPSHEAKESLSKATGLTRKQIQNWFTNSRKRFWEPSKKKIEVKKSGDVTPNESQGVEQSMDIQPRQNPVEPILSQPNISSGPEPVNVSQNLQPKPIVQFMPQFQNVVSPSVLKPISPVTPQRFQLPQNQMQNQTFVYQGMMPQGVMQNGNNIVILPYFVSQPPMAYPYRPPEMMAMNGSFIQFPQGNMQIMEQPSMMQNSAMGNPYFVPFQPNMMDMRGNGQNFNTINNNVYNNINNLGTIGNIGPLGNPGSIGGLTDFNNMPNMQNMPNMTNITNITNMNPNINQLSEKSQSFNRINQNDMQGMGGMGSPRSWQRNMNGGMIGMHHAKPELDDMNHQGRKHLHKDLNPQNNTS